MTSLGAPGRAESALAAPDKSGSGRAYVGARRGNPARRIGAQRTTPGLARAVCFMIYSAAASSPDTRRRVVG